MKLRNERSFNLFIFMAIAIVSTFLVLSVNAYFTASANKNKDTAFANLSVAFTDLNGSDVELEETLSQSIGQVMPGQIIDLSGFKVKNTGDEDIYSIINLKLTITKSTGEIKNISEWYNLSGTQIYHTALNANTAPATLISKNSSATLNLQYELAGYMFDQSYVGADMHVKILACAIQARNLPNYNEVTSQPVIASCMMVEDFYIPVEINNVGYRLKSGNNSYEAFAATKDITEANILSTVEGKPVTSIATEGFMGCTELVSVVVPSSITSLYQACFKDCTSLSSVDFQCEQATFWAEVFMNCTSLKSIDLPNFTDGNLRSRLFYASGLESIDIPYGTKNIYEQAFWYASSLKSVNIPDTVESIGNYALRATGLESVFIPNSVKTMGGIQFHGSPNLKSIIFEEGSPITELAGYMFSDCPNLTNVQLPSGLLSLGISAFNNCTSLATIDIPDTMTTIPEAMFYLCRSLNNIVLPDNITTIKNNAFCGCSSLTSIVIPNKVTTIADRAFQSCTSLAEVTLPVSLQSSGYCTFYGCDNIRVNYLGTVSQWKTITFDANFGNPLKNKNAKLYVKVSGTWTDVTDML